MFDGAVFLSVLWRLILIERSLVICAFGKFSQATVGKGLAVPKETPFTNGPL